MKNKLRINLLFIKSITIVFVHVSWLKKKPLLFSLLSHTLIIILKGNNTLLSPFYFLLHAQLSLSWLSSFSLSGSLLVAFSFFLCSTYFSIFFNMQQYSLLLLSLLWLSFQKRQHFTLSSFLRSSQAKTSFSLLVSRSIFPLPIGRTFGSKPSNSL